MLFRHHHKRSKAVRLVFSEAILSVVGLILIILMLIPLIKNQNKRAQSDVIIQELQTKIKNLEEQNQRLEKLIKYLESDNFVEEKARLDMGLKKEGEEVVVITNLLASSSSETAQSSPLTSGRTKLSNPQKWFNYFFKHNYESR